MKPIQVFSVWSYDTTLEQPLVTKLTTTCNQHTAEERALWDYAQLQRGRTFAIVQEPLPQTEPPTQEILRACVVPDAAGRTDRAPA